jgi:putative DNA-invertase from lambdoid prophage Rac
MMATVLAGIAEFEREPTAERIRSGIAAAKARGKKLASNPDNGRSRTGSHPGAGVLVLVAQGRSYRLIGREVGLSKKHGGGDRPTGSKTFGQAMTQELFTFCSA